MRASLRRRAGWALAAIVLVIVSYLTFFLVAHAQLTQTREHRGLCMYSVISTLASDCDVHKRLPLAVVTDDPAETSVFGVTGPGTAFDRNVRQCLPNRWRRGVANPRR